MPGSVLRSPLGVTGLLVVLLLASSCPHAGGAGPVPVREAPEVLDGSGVAGPPRLFPSAPLSAAYDPATDQLFFGLDGSGLLNSSNATTPEVDVVDMATETIVGNVTVSARPTALFYNPVSGHVLATLSGSAQSTVAVIDPATEHVLREVPVGRLAGPMIYDPSDGDLWVSGSGTLLNASNETPVGSVAPSGGLVFDGAAGAVFGLGLVYSAVNGSVVGNFSTPTNSYGIGFDARSGDVFVLSSPTGYKIEPGNIEVVHAANRSVIDSIGLGTPASAVVWDALSNEIYVAESPGYHSSSSPGIEVYDPTSFSQLRTIPIASGPREFVMTPDGRLLFSVNDGPGNGSAYVSVVGAATDSVLGSIPREYPLTFAVRGLPPQGAVMLTLEPLHESDLVVVGGTVVDSLPNGTIAYGLSGALNVSVPPALPDVRPLPNYSLAMPASGALVIDGTPVNFTAEFVRNSTSGSAMALDWEGIVAAGVGATVLAVVVAVEVRRRHRPPTSSPSGIPPTP